MSQSSSVGFTPALKKSENDDEEVLADPVQLRENVLQHYYDSVESLKGGFRERLQELFFIQSGGNMVDYPAWKMRSNTHLLTFLNAFRLDDNISFSTPTATNTISPSVKMQAVYTTAESSAIDVQNNKAVKSEIVPNQSIKSEIKLERNLSVQRPSTPQNHTIEMHEDIAGQVRKESEILDRVAYLRKNGLWSTSRLPKVYEQPRKKSHWDFMQEEMQWLAADFAQEKKWKRNMAKKLSRAVLKYHQECASQTKKAEREETIRLKRIASGISKEIKQFWQAIEKVACFKQQSRQEEQRKKALDLHLNFIVDQTEKYSSWLVEGMKEPSSLNSPASSSIAVDAEDEFEPGNEGTEDDETTIAQEEEDVNDEETDDELEALRRESEMPIEDLIETIPESIRHEIAGQSSSKSDMSGPSKIGSDDGISESDSSEYEASDVEEDDEQTIDVEEKQDDDQNYEDELAQLQKENEIPIEELLKNYGKTTDDAEEIKESSESEYEEDDDEEEIKKDLPLSTLVNQENSNMAEATDTTVPNKELNDAAATAESLQPKGFTLSTVQVKTSVPFLLKHTLREYQHIGLDWLVTMYAKQLNGILADEMGLGKTIQTIALLAHLACEEGCWGPHLIVVPTSVMLNWELEFKKWCPAFKILTYFGTQKERKLKRTGWCKPNAFHICITSYKLVIQDHQAFKRRKWRYLILDEAQNIKNFKSQRWQILLNFNSQRRLLLTGTPLQNSLMELWSLMHFLMPNIFTSHQDFKEWFANPLTGMIEGSREYSEGIIKRLHTVLRPFLLRRLKTEVELQMPKKYEHVIKCRLSKRQRFLYDEFMGRTKTKETIAAGNFLSVINILMQLRKVCNHPDLFELRPTVSPFVMDQVVYHTASLVDSALTRDPLETVDLPSWNFCLADLETSTAALQSYRVQQLKQKLIEDVTSSENAKTEPHVTGSSSFKTSAKRSNSNGERSYMDIMTIAQTTYGCASIGDILTRQVEESLEASNVDVVNDDDKDVTTGNELEPPLPKKRKIQIHTSKLLTDYLPKEEDSPYFSSTLKIKADSEESHRLENLSLFNDRHCAASPMYGTDLRTKLTVVKSNTFFYNAQSVQCGCDTLQTFVKTPKQRLVELKSITDRFALFINPVLAPKIEMRMFHPQPSKVQHELNLQENITHLCKQPLDVLYPLRLMSLIQFPETRLVQYDCGKLQALNELLRQLKIGKHRVLIFTQMTKMLDVLERFLNYHGYIYLRLDGNTKVEQRQMLMERFNQDDKIFIFILSTRSGGIGVNLTGADTVVFYDSDWNPTMDAQAQDRCHRIGQTRDVHIYRLISDRTVEENILKKAHQKRLLGNIAIEGGNFTTAFFKQDTVKELFNEEPIDLLTVEPTKESSTATKADGSEPADAQYEKVLCTAEEEEDAKAAENVKKEVELELVEFNDNNTTTAEEQKQDSKVEAELRELESQLRPIELCALKFMEATEMFTVDDEVEETERRIKQAKKDWELNHMRSMKEAEEQRYADEEDDMFFTYERDSTYGQDFVDDYTGITMPVWMPPTPPQDSETEEYVTDPCVGFLYENDTIPDNHLPPTHYIKKNGIDIYSMKRNTARTHYLSHFKNKRARVSKAKSIFDKKALELLTNKSKLKKSQKLKLKAMTVPNAPSTSVVKPDFSQHGPDWLINEDWALLQTVNVLSELPVDVVNESLHSRSVNWDLAADVVNAFSRSYRSSRQCKDRYQNIIIAREDGKLMVTTDTNDVKTKKKQKLSNPTTTTTVTQQQQTVQQASVDGSVSVTKPLQQQPQAKTSIQFSADHGKSVLSMHFSKFESVKKAAAKRKPPLKQQNAKGQGGRSTQILVTNGTPSLEKPLNPKDLATMRAERIAKEKAQAVLAAQQTTTATCTTTTTTTSTPPATRTTTASAAATQQQQHQIYFKGNQIVKGAAANNTNAANIRGNLVFTTTSSVAGTLVVNPAAVSSVTTATSFRKQNTVAVTSPVTGNLTHASMSNTARILTASQNMTIGGKTATSSSIIAPNLVAQVQRCTTGISTGSTAAGLITTHPFIQGKPLTPQQINILRQKAVQQQQQQQILKLQQQQQRLQQQKQQQQQFKIMQQQQMQTQTTKHGAQPTIVVSSTQLANLTVQTIKAPLRGSVPQQIVTQSLTAAQQQQLLQQALKNKQLQQLQQRGQLQASNSQIQQMLAGQKLTHQQLQQLQQQQQRHSLQQQLKFQPQQVSAAMVSSQHKPQLVMAQVKQGINSQSLKSSAQQIQLHQLQQGASVQGGSLPQQILLRPTLTQTSGQYQGVPQQIHLRALINQSNQQRAGNQQAMQAQVNIQTGTVVMQQQTSQASTLAQQQQRNIQAAVQKQVLQQQKSQAKSPQTISSPQSQRQQVLSATPAQLSQVKAFVSQATQQQQHQPGTHSPSTVTSSPAIQLQAQQVGQQMRRQAQLVQVKLADDNKKKVASQTTQSETVVMDHQLTDGVTTLGAETELSTGETSAEDHGTRTARTHK